MTFLPVAQLIIVLQTAPPRHVIVRVENDIVFFFLKFTRNLNFVYWPTACLHCTISLSFNDFLDFAISLETMLYDRYF